jgi:hypothetical protein
MVGVWTTVAAEGRGSGRGPWVALSRIGTIRYGFTNYGWSAAVSDGLLELPIPL